MSRARGLIAIMTAIACIALPRTVLAGAFYIQGQRCWCEGNTVPGHWNVFPVWFVVNDRSECDDAVSIVGAAFRIAGVPDDPALMRRFEAEAFVPMTGDAF